MSGPICVGATQKTTFVVAVVGPPGCPIVNLVPLIAKHCNFLQEGHVVVPCHQDPFAVEDSKALIYELLDRSIHTAANSASRGVILESVSPEVVPFVEQTCKQYGMKLDCLFFLDAENVLELIAEVQRETRRKLGASPRNVLTSIHDFLCSESALLKMQASSNFFKLDASQPKADLAKKMLEIINGLLGASSPPSLENEDFQQLINCESSSKDFAPPNFPFLQFASNKSIILRVFQKLQLLAGLPRRCFYPGGFVTAAEEDSIMTVFSSGADYVVSRGRKGGMPCLLLYFANERNFYFINFGLEVYYVRIPTKFSCDNDVLLDGELFNYHNTVGCFVISDVLFFKNAVLEEPLESRLSHIQSDFAPEESKMDELLHACEANTVVLVRKTYFDLSSNLPNLVAEVNASGSTLTSSSSSISVSSSSSVSAAGIHQVTRLLFTPRTSGFKAARHLLEWRPAEKSIPIDLRLTDVVGGGYQFMVGALVNGVFREIVLDNVDESLQRPHDLMNLIGTIVSCLPLRPHLWQIVATKRDKSLPDLISSIGAGQLPTWRMLQLTHEAQVREATTRLQQQQQPLLVPSSSSPSPSTFSSSSSSTTVNELTNNTMSSSSSSSGLEVAAAGSLTPLKSDSTNQVSASSSSSLSSSSSSSLSSSSSSTSLETQQHQQPLTPSKQQQQPIDDNAFITPARASPTTTTSSSSPSAVSSSSPSAGGVPFPPPPPSLHQHIVQNLPHHLLDQLPPQVLSHLAQHLAHHILAQHHQMQHQRFQPQQHIHMHQHMHSHMPHHHHSQQQQPLMSPAGHPSFLPSPTSMIPQPGQMLYHPQLGPSPLPFPQLTTQQQLGTPTTTKAGGMMMCSPPQQQPSASGMMMTMPMQVPPPPFPVQQQQQQQMHSSGFFPTPPPPSSQYSPSSVFPVVAPGTTTTTTTSSIDSNTIPDEAVLFAKPSHGIAADGNGSFGATKAFFSKDNTSGSYYGLNNEALQFQNGNNHAQQALTSSFSSSSSSSFALASSLEPVLLPDEPAMFSSAGNAKPKAWSPMNQESKQPRRWVPSTNKNHADSSGIQDSGKSGMKRGFAPESLLPSLIESDDSIPSHHHNNTHYESSAKAENGGFFEK